MRPSALFMSLTVIIMIMQLKQSIQNIRSCLAFILLLSAANIAVAETDKINHSHPPDQGVQVETLSLEQALDIAMSGNPGLAEMKARAEAMAAIPLQAGTLPDPQVSIGLANLPTDSFSTSQEAMTQWQFKISQAIPYPGTLALREARAEHMARAASFDSEEFRQLLKQDIKTLWWRLFYMDKAIVIIDVNKTLLRQLIEIAETKYKVGQGLQQDVLLAQLELSKLLDQEIEIKSMRHHAQSRLNALLNRSTELTVSLPQADTIDTSLPDLKPLPELLALAETQRPALAQQRQKIAAARSDKELAEKDLLPDFKLSGGYGIRQGHDMDGGRRSDFLSVELGIEVPLFADRKQKMAISQKNSELKQQKFALQDAWNRIRADISSAFVSYQQSREQRQLLEQGILPQAQQTVASMLAGYQVNKVDFLNLIRAQITLYNYETNLWRHISDAKTRLAELAANVGEDNIHE